MKRQMILLLAIFWIGCAGLQPRPVFRVPEKENREMEMPPQKDKEPPEETTRPDEHPTSSEPDLYFVHEKLMRQIEELLGVPYRYGGTSRKGMDCSGFVYYVYKKTLGIELPRQVRELYHFANPVLADDLKMGDLVFFRFSRTKGVDHVGIYLSDGQFAHASRSRGVVISSLRSGYYRDHFVEARRVPLR